MIRSSSPGSSTAFMQMVMIPRLPAVMNDDGHSEDHLPRCRSAASSSTVVGDDMQMTMPAPLMSIVVIARLQMNADDDTMIAYHYDDDCTSNEYIGDVNGSETIRFDRFSLSASLTFSRAYQILYAVPVIKMVCEASTNGFAMGIRAVVTALAVAYAY